MKKIFPFMLATALLLNACGTKPSADSSSNAETSAPVQSQETQATETTEVPIDNSLIPADAESDETKLGKAITYSVKDETLYFKIKTSAEFDAQNARIAIVNPGIYLTRDSELITQCLFDENCFDETHDKEWFDGVYTFALDSRIADIAADDEWAPGTWTMMLYDGESGIVLGEWFFIAEGNGKYHFAFKDSWLKGAGEDKKVQEFDSPEDEVASWFSFAPDESDDEWATVFFDGYYLESTDTEGYDSYYLMVCPEGDYATYADADAADITYCGIGNRCPYRFSFEQGNIENGKYTLALAKMGGNVEVQFTAEKKGPTEWEFDFENAKCPALESKYAE